MYNHNKVSNERLSGYCYVLQILAQNIPDILRAKIKNYAYVYRMGQKITQHIFEYQNRRTDIE